MSRRAAKPAPAPARAIPVRRELSPALRTACRLAPLAALAALVWSLRGGMPGTAVADDYAFLARLVFQRPLDPFDSMGGAFYWRPLSRQLWYSLVGPWMLHAPLLMAALNTAVLGGISLLCYRIVRGLRWDEAARSAPSGSAREGSAHSRAIAMASLAATVPLLSEPARALVDWPSGAQHLLAVLFAALTLHEALAGRRASATAAAFAALLSHEASVFVVALMPFVGARRVPRDRMGWAGLAALAIALWASGYALARTHGVQLPPLSPANIPRQMFAAIAHVFAAATGSEGAPIAARTATLAVGVMALVPAALALRQREPRRWLLLCVAVPLVATVPLAGLLPDWNAWRAFLPVTLIAMAITLALGAVRVELALACVALRMVSLLIAETPAPIRVSPPVTVSDLSYVRLVRLQRIVSGIRPVIERGPLRSGGRVGFWGLPRAAEVGFHRDLAARVWTRDSTVRFGPFGGLDGFAHPPDLAIGFNLYSGTPPVRIAPGAMAMYGRGLDQARAQHFDAADSIYQLVIPLQPDSSDAMIGQVLISRALLAVARDMPVLADSLNRRSRLYQGIAPESLGIEAWLALRRGNLPLARAEIADFLANAPTNEFALELKQDLERLERARANRE